ncbi:major facilitator transporter [Nocardioides sp. CF8]|uniref:MFS transporter n=1 Tax=Nocardioides sp. CF8 TaxID=110319 RepID=UPI000331321B|nr:major facilitator transporter [Nocardioides sp. CF8]
MSEVTGSAPTRALLSLAAVAVAFAAADTYVVVLALPDMMTSVGVPIDQLQRAAPIISGFLLGYVAMLPLIGRIADLRGRVPVLVFSLVLFALGSLVTALAYDMPSMVIGRFLQGVGGGGLVPATLALVADLYPKERRGVPLGIVSAVQEIGSVIGPLFGAVVLAFADWRAIFLINLAVGLLLAAALRSIASPLAELPADSPLVEQARQRRVETKVKRPDLLGALLLVATLVAGALVFVRPAELLRDLTWGQLFIPYVGSGRWLTPIGLIAIGAALLLVARCLVAKRPLLDLRRWGASLVEADLVGALLLAVALAGVILAFATADPKIQVFSDRGWWFLLGSAVASVLFVAHLRRAAAPLLPRGALRRTPAWGALLVSFFIGAALIAALIDIPLFARTTVYPDSQLAAALVLVRFLVALPVGAVIGGYLIRRLSPGVVTAAGMLLAAAGFVLMAQWGLTTVEEPIANLGLITGGLGFGLALAPVNAALLAFTDDDVHGVASAFVVVSRMVGMLVGISALTTIGLRRYYSEQGVIPPVREVCDGKTRCKEFSDLLRVAGIAQEHTVFYGAAVCAVVAAVLALVLFRTATATPLSTRDALSIH